MSRFKNALNARDAHIWTLRGTCVLLILVCLVLALGWMNAPRNLTIHQPPDLRSGSPRPWWEVPPSTVYAFGFYVFQQLNSWPKDGEQDYPARIKSLSPYLTPECQTLLEDDARKRNFSGELRERVRGIYEIPGRGYRGDRVEIVDRDHWVIRLDLTADEYYHNEPVKRALVRYPLKVVRWDVNPELNPFGLALDCFAAMPQRLEAAPVDVPEKKGIF
ncbi:lipoprotein [Klebsiella pneumoniae]|uniref:PFL_4703 family integrating conjugative element protein n=1 Tax=Klebsiella pneumoniae TaxID=573 RepID=UPI00285BBF46|nr:TIGR03746 family integrating conjugative element protein [Klebsiella pneumoniae]MDR8646392.1 lipoprotein [Klebsiella pneumoniae]MDS1333718.1 lipoprotein [Klebsiella pneumoniae]MDS1417703.1 lipoprotein [Klebsiella pneumoniae]